MHVIRNADSRGLPFAEPTARAHRDRGSPGPVQSGRPSEGSLVPGARSLLALALLLVASCGGGRGGGGGGFARPPAQPASGPGGSAATYSSFVVHTYLSADDEYWLFEP